MTAVIEWWEIPGDKYHIMGEDLAFFIVGYIGAYRRCQWNAQSSTGRTIPTWLSIVVMLMSVMMVEMLVEQILCKGPHCLLCNWRPAN